MLSSQGLICSMHLSEGSLSFEFATQEGTTYVVESSQDLASGQWEAVTTVEGSEPLVLTFDFPQNAHSQTPGVASAN